MSKQLFTTNQGIRLNLSSSAISERMRRRIRAHKYECAELASIPKILQHRERVLEVGAGIGYVSAHAYNTGLVEHLTVIEANPYLVPVISETHNLNMVRSDIINGCLGKEGGVTNFYIHENTCNSFC
jgi:16S rRNA A1518/A1519 N6-dimethyltransferase RsmA/KsgA/DIM1 with predicted DNA glycosylase/AP lyase activity